MFTLQPHCSRSKAITEMSVNFGSISPATTPNIVGALSTCSPIRRRKPHRMLEDWPVGHRTCRVQDQRSLSQEPWQAVKHGQARPSLVPCFLGSLGSLPIHFHLGTSNSLPRDKREAKDGRGGRRWRLLADMDEIPGELFEESLDVAVRGFYVLAVRKPPRPSDCLSSCTRTSRILSVLSRPFILASHCRHQTRMFIETLTLLPIPHLHIHTHTPPPTLARAATSFLPRPARSKLDICRSSTDASWTLRAHHAASSHNAQRSRAEIEGAPFFHHFAIHRGLVPYTRPSTYEAGTTGYCVSHFV